MRFRDQKNAAIPQRGYRLVVADPPWTFENYAENFVGRGPEYETMTTDEITAMWDDPDLGMSSGIHRHAVLALWATAPMLDVAMDVMRAWGFTYKTRFVWRKTTVNKKRRMGYGHVARTCTEIALIGYRGVPASARMAYPDEFDAINHGHSQKPEKFQTMLEIMWPSLTPRLELFGRRYREGWDVLGNEVGALPPYQDSF